ncbi:MAG: hypothetical protein KGI50_06775 [Patescibacteria group bacterium]|nr:hypothetical protein [Patescibacteria group bacterium]
MSSKESKIRLLKNLIEHPATPAAEVEAARLALDRILNPTIKQRAEGGQQKKKVTTATLFQRAMRSKGNA